MPTMRFDLVTLRIFVAVAHSGSISAASAFENIAVSAVSKRISDLELDLGIKLLERRPRGVELTPAGTALLHHAGVILRSVDQLESDLGDYALGVKGHVRMVVNISSVLQFLPDDLREFSREYPDIKVDLREANSTDVVAAVAAGRAEIGIFTAGLTLPNDVQVRAYREDRLAVIVPREHPLASCAKVPFSRVLDEDIVGLDVGSASYEVLGAAAKRAGRPLRLRLRLSGFDAVCRMINAGLGVGIAPPAMLDAFTVGASLIGVELDEAWAHRRLQIVTRDPDGLPVSARLMLDHLARHAAGPA